MAKFFDQYPDFYSTSETTPQPSRLAYRYELIIEHNKNLLMGKRVLDFASHDGRWAFAALKGGGASYVMGLEPRRRLVDNSIASFQKYDVAKSSYDFVCGDGFNQLEQLRRDKKSFDVGLVLGFLYHTARQYEVIYRMAELGCSAIIVDTEVLRNVTEPLVRIAFEATQSESNVFTTGKKRELVAKPSLIAVHQMLLAAGYEPRLVVIPQAPPATHCYDYQTGGRFTILGVKQ